MLERSRFARAMLSTTLAVSPAPAMLEQQHSPDISKTSVTQQAFLGIPLEGDNRTEAEPTIAAGFQDKTVITGVANPTSVRFGKDGSVFVAEKKGIIKQYSDITDTTSTVVADLTDRVMSGWDRGLLSIETDPRDPNKLYALYTVDAPPKKEPPVYKDECVDRVAKCVVDGELDVLFLDPTTKKMKDRKPLLRNMLPQQFSSHSVGTVRWNPKDNKLYVSAGDGASFTEVDYGQHKTEPPMGDPPNEGGALRAQTMRTFSGGLTRIDPDTGAAKTVSKGMRNPFRFTFGPGKSAFVGDVGWNTWEEVNRDADITDSKIANFGWPCYEGVPRQPKYDEANLKVCEDLYAKGANAVVAPSLAEKHAGVSSAISGLAQNTGNAFPPEFKGGLFIANYGEKTINVYPAGPDGFPDPKRKLPIATGVMPTELQFGPDGNLYYTDIIQNRVQQISHPANREPKAVITADKKFGTLPLKVTMDAIKSVDPDVGDQEKLSYAWDTDGNGSYETPGKKVTKEYKDSKNVTIGLQVKDSKGAIGKAQEVLYPGDTPPEPKIDKPLNGQKFKPGDVVTVSGSAPDKEEGQIPANKIVTTVTIYHCPSPTDCHPHQLSQTTGKLYTFTFPEHGKPAEYNVQVSQTATDNRGLSASSNVTIGKK